MDVDYKNTNDSDLGDMLEEIAIKHEMEKERENVDAMIESANSKTEITIPNQLIWRGVLQVGGKKGYLEFDILPYIDFSLLGGVEEITKFNNMLSDALFTALMGSAVTRNPPGSVPIVDTNITTGTNETDKKTDIKTE